MTDATAASPICCVNDQCMKPLPGEVRFCPFCGVSAPEVVTPPVVTPPVAGPVAAPAAAVPPPPIPAAPSLAAPAGVESAPPPAPAAPPSPPQAPPAPGPKRSAKPPTPAAPISPAPVHRPRSRVPLVLVCLVLGGVFWTIFLRDRGAPPTVPAGRIEQHRTAVESCLARADLACARIALLDMQRELPGDENWRDLQVRVTALETNLAKQAEPALPTRAAAPAPAPSPTDVPEPVNTQIAPTPPAPASVPDRAAQVDAASRERAPVRYPPEAVRAGARGNVLLTIEVAEDGTATAISVTRTSRERSLDRAALDAARRWRYLPAIRDGRAYASAIQLEVNFSPDAGNPSDMADLRQPDNSYPPKAPTIAPPAAAPEAGLLSKARAELQQGRYDVAVALGESALQVNPDSAAARSLIRQAKAERDRVMRETTIE